jgi:hypothetical protein
MNRKYKFAADAVTQLRQSLDEIPPCPVTELSKQQMIHVGERQKARKTEQPDTSGMSGWGPGAAVSALGRRLLVAS